MPRKPKAPVLNPTPEYVAEHSAFSVVEGDDLSPAPSAPLGEVAPTQEVEAPPPVQLESSHALDAAPINSKIVVTEDGAVLALPDDFKVLPPSDIASALPRGARIRKDGHRTYVATQLNATVSYPERTYGSASEAIQDFVVHFHPRNPN